MKSFNYLKIDFRTIGKQKFLIFFYPIFLLFFFRDASMITWMSLFTLPTMMTLPFNLPDVNSCHRLSFTLPGHIKNIVAGRFLFLILVALYTTTVIYIGISIMEPISQYSPITELFYFLGVCIVCLMVCIQYIAFYKIDNRNKSFISIMIFLPAVIVSLGNIYAGDKVLEFSHLYAYLLNHSNIILLGTLLFTLIILYLSYRICIEICKTKDV